MELISVVVPVYNRAGIFEETLRSIVSQTYRPLEIIVVDDGSHEDIRTIFDLFEAQHRNSRCTFQFFRQENRGAPAARNLGRAHATGEYIIFWDADTVGTGEMLEQMYRALQIHSDASFAYSNFLFGKKVIRGMDFSYEQLRKKNYIMSTSLIRTRDAVSWDESLKRFQDWDLWLTMAEEGKKGVWIDAVLFRVQAGGTMSSWLPSIAYRIPFRYIPFIRSRVLRHNESKWVVQQKHSLVS